MGSCTFRDQARIGKLQAVKIESMVADEWTIADIDVEIEGLTGSWWYQGNSVLRQGETLNLNLEYTSTYILVF